MCDCLVLTGPTAVGKTASLTALQDQLQRPLEVISADAFQVYRGLDLGTAKPDAALCSRIPHHLLDIRYISEQFTVADFVNEAGKLIAEIRGRGSIPVVCGGAVYYLKHLIWGLPQTPASDDTIRQAIASEYERVGAIGLYEKLLEIDPISARSLDTGDVYRISRALEVWQLSGRPLSSYARENPQPVFRVLLIGLHKDRGLLVETIEKRVDAMISAGLPAEVSALLSQGFKATDPGMRAIGYKEFLETARGSGYSFSEKEIQAITSAIKIHTRQYSKRQMTFLRSLPNIHWLPADRPQEIPRQLISLAAEYAPGLLT